MSLESIVGFLAGALLAAIALYFLVIRRAVERAQTFAVEIAGLKERVGQIERLESELTQRSTELNALNQRVVGYETEKTRLETELSTRERAIQESKMLLEQAKEEFKEVFEALSSKALRNNNQNFLDLAKEHLSRKESESQSELDKRKQAIEELVKPLAEKLGVFDEKVNSIEEKRIKAYEGIDKMLGHLRESQGSLESETRKLVSALRNPSRRGTWGEIQLRRVIEMAGMIQYCDFELQVSVNTEAGRLRPDAVIRLPNERKIVVDAKTALDAYTYAIEEDDEEKKRGYYKDHARQVRTHIDQLSRKDYYDQFEHAPELVVMFIPGESLYSAALEFDPQLIEYGAEKRVLIATPTTLIGMLRAVHFGWREASMERDAQEIAKTGRELYKRFAKVMQHLVSVGKGLDSAVGSYNALISSVDSRLVPQLRRFEEFPAVVSAQEAIVEIHPIEKASIEPATLSALPGLED